MRTSPFADQNADQSAPNQWAINANAEHEIPPSMAGHRRRASSELDALNSSVRSERGVAVVWSARGKAKFIESSPLGIQSLRPTLLDAGLVTSWLRDPSLPGASICVR